MERARDKMLCENFTQKSHPPEQERAERKHGESMWEAGKRRREQKEIEERSGR